MLGSDAGMGRISCVWALTDGPGPLYTGLVIEGALGHLWRACSGASFIPIGH